MAERDRRRYWVWSSAWLAYASYYLGRKAFSATKRAIEGDGLLSLRQLGYVDSGYLAAYALGQFVNGTLGDRVGARRLVGCGLLGSALLCAAFGMSNVALLSMLFFTVNGVAQATGWPGVTRAMTEWTTPENRGKVMGWWSTCYQAGPLLAGALAGYLLQQSGWRSVFLWPMLLMAAVALLVLLVMKPGPARPGQPLFSGGELVLARRSAQRAVLRDRALWSYGASYFCIKLMRYALQLWLPYYLQKQLAYRGDVANYVASAFEAGGLVGVVVIGWLSDRPSLGRVKLSAASLLALSVALFGCAAFVGQNTALNVVLLALLGAFLFAPDSILCGAAAQDAGGDHAASMATGFVNGIGSMGALMVGVVLPPLVESWGWSLLFPSLIGVSLLSAACLLPTLRVR